MPTTMSPKSDPIQHQVDALNADHAAMNSRARQISQKRTARPSADALWFWLEDLGPAGADPTGDGRST
jgi:hypothetical protein